MPGKIGNEGNSGKNNGSSPLDRDRKQLEKSERKSERKSEKRDSKETEKIDKESQRAARRNNPSIDSTIRDSSKNDIGDTVSIRREARGAPKESPQAEAIRGALKNKNEDGKASEKAIAKGDGVGTPKDGGVASPSEEANKLISKINITDANLRDAVAVSERQSAAVSAIQQAEKDGDTERADEKRQELKELDKQRAEQSDKVVRDTQTPERAQAQAPKGPEARASKVPEVPLRKSVTAGADLTSSKDLNRIQNDLSSEQGQLADAQKQLDETRKQAESETAQVNAASARNRPDPVRSEPRADDIVTSIARSLRSTPPQEAVVNNLDAGKVSALLNA